MAQPTASCCLNLPVQFAVKKIQLLPLDLPNLNLLCLVSPLPSPTCSGQLNQADISIINCRLSRVFEFGLFFRNAVFIDSESPWDTVALLQALGKYADSTGCVCNTSCLCTEKPWPFPVFSPWSTQEAERVPGPCQMEMFGNFKATKPKPIFCDHVVLGVIFPLFP